MKVLVLVAGFVGTLGFFEPFFAIGNAEISAYRLARADDWEVTRLTDERLTDDGYNVSVGGESVQPRRTRAMVPFYFLSAIVFFVIGFIAVTRGRLSGTLALFSLCGAMFALGGWMREYRFDRDLVRDGLPSHMTVGATLLLVSGLLGLIGSIAVLVKREPEVPKPPPPPPDIPEARVIK